MDFKFVLSIIYINIEGKPQLEVNSTYYVSVNIYGDQKTFLEMIF